MFMIYVILYRLQLKHNRNCYMHVCKFTFELCTIDFSCVQKLVHILYSLSSEPSGQSMKPSPMCSRGTQSVEFDLHGFDTSKSHPPSEKSSPVNKNIFN